MSIVQTVKIVLKLWIYVQMVESIAKNVVIMKVICVKSVAYVWKQQEWKPVISVDTALNVVNMKQKI